MKKGVSLISLIVSIIIITIILGIIAVTSFDSIDVVTINEFALEIYDIQTAVDEYKERNEKYPVGDTYVLSMSKIPSNSKAQFTDEQITSEAINFKKVDLSLLGINNNKLGLGKEDDIYVLSEQTGKVYYIQGVEFEELTHYTITDKILEILGITSGNKPSFGIKMEDVIFELSTEEYTKEPITVKVKIPIDAEFTAISTQNFISVVDVGTEGQEKVKEVNTTDSKTGNYYIKVNYTYQGVSKFVQYDVVNYDDEQPKLTVSETLKDDLNIIKITAQDTKSGVGEIKYAKDIITDKTYFDNQGIKLEGGELRVDLSTPYTICVKDKVGNSTIYNGMPDDWRPNVTTLVDGVPIPKGFVASPYNGENARDGGLVIYQLTPEEIENKVNALPIDEETQFESWTTRNQYVWIPVNKYKFATEFVRKDYRTNKVGPSVDEDGNYFPLGTTDTAWELEVNPVTNMPLSMKDTTDYKLDGTLNFISERTLLEAQEMYKSVKEYGGFYIARYEAGIDTQRRVTDTKDTLPRGLENVHSKMGKIPYTYIPWTWSGGMSSDTYGAVEISRELYPDDATNKTGVISTLIYGAQWNRTLQWLLDTKRLANFSNARPYGNFFTTPTVNKTSLNEDTLIWDYSASTTGDYVSIDSDTLTWPKSTKTWALSTGALKAANLNNIYDLAGNMAELTMEGISTSQRAVRGGQANGDGAGGGLDYYYGYSATGRGILLGFRVTLYIKLP